MDLRIIWQYQTSAHLFRDFHLQTFRNSPERDRLYEFDENGNNLGEYYMVIFGSTFLHSINTRRTQLTILRNSRGAVNLYRKQELRSIKRDKAVRIFCN